MPDRIHAASIRPFRLGGFHLPSGERDLLEVFRQPDVDPRMVPAAFDSGLLIALAVEDVEPNGIPPRVDRPGRPDRVHP